MKRRTFLQALAGAIVSAALPLGRVFAPGGEVEAKKPMVEEVSYWFSYCYQKKSCLIEAASERLDAD